jgi:hypothetical protein
MKPERITTEGSIDARLEATSRLLTPPPAKASDQPRHPVRSDLRLCDLKLTEPL